MFLSSRSRSWPTASLLAVLIPFRDECCLGFTPTLLTPSRHNHFLLHSANPQTSEQQSRKNSSPGNPFIQWLAELSLEDYQWRSDVFKSNAADRMLEESLARMRGENATYVRPMDATLPGPLGRWEKASVAWLSSVIEEEARRAKRIVENAGTLIRPLDIADGEALGPLGYIEQRVVEFFALIRRAEQERVRTQTLRPKDVDEPFRGPLGELEVQTVRIFEEIRSSEKQRAQQIKARGGEMVRPIDVPGPLGELEMKVAAIFEAEKRRTHEGAAAGHGVVRPKDAQFKGPLGKAESEAHATLRSLSAEEMDRLRSIRNFLLERRPMDANSDSILGKVEAVLVGLLRAPRLVAGVFERVNELLRSEALVEEEVSGSKHVESKNKEAPPTSQPKEGFQ